MLWQLFVAFFVPFIPIEPKFVRAYDTPKFRLVFECDGFETTFEFVKELVRENNDIVYNSWRRMRQFYSEFVAGRQLAEKEA
jgi:hypothetical protein